MGVSLAKNKTVGPTNILPFVGYIIDTELMMVFIPFEKKEKFSRLLQSLLVRKKIKRSELESIVGLMSFCSSAIPSSRSFLRRLYGLVTTVKKPFHRIRLLSEVKSDIRPWLLFLEEFNGQCYFPDRLWISNETLQLYIQMLQVQATLTYVVQLFTMVDGHRVFSPFHGERKHS